MRKWFKKNREFNRTSLVETPGDRQNAFALFRIRILTNIICIEKTSKGTEIVFVLTRFYCSSNQNRNSSTLYIVLLDHGFNPEFSHIHGVATLKSLTFLY